MHFVHFWHLNPPLNITTQPSYATDSSISPHCTVAMTTDMDRFPGCRPTDMKRSTRRRDFSRIVIHLLSTTENCLPNPFSDYSLDWTSPKLSLSSGPNDSLYYRYLGHFQNPRLIDIFPAITPLCLDNLCLKSAHRLLLLWGEHSHHFWSLLAFSLSS